MGCKLPALLLLGSCRLLLPESFRLALFTLLLALNFAGFPVVVVVDFVLDFLAFGSQHVLVLAADVLDDKLTLDEELLAKLVAPSAQQSLVGEGGRARFVWLGIGSEAGVGLGTQGLGYN